MKHARQYHLAEKTSTYLIKRNVKENEIHTKLMQGTYCKNLEEALLKEVYFRL